MEFLTKKLIQELLAADHTPCLSLYMIGFLKATVTHLLKLNSLLKFQKP